MIRVKDAVKLRSMNHIIIFRRGSSNQVDPCRNRTLKFERVNTVIISSGRIRKIFASLNFCKKTLVDCVFESTIYDCQQRQQSMRSHRKDAKQLLRHCAGRILLQVIENNDSPILTSYACTVQVM